MIEQSVVSNRIAAASQNEPPGGRLRRPYQQPQLVELGPIHELTRGDAGTNDDLGTTRVA